MRILAALLFLCMIASAQPAEQHDCSADGVVVNSLTDAPIARARVTDNKNDGTLTDESGKWSLAHVACGSITLSAGRQNFLADPAPTAFRLVSGTPLHDVKIRLAPQAAVTGRVIDDHGDPIQNAAVAVMGSHVVEGVRRLAYSSSGGTNDIGEYRIAGLAAGKYVFCATVSNQRNPRGAEPRAFEQQCSSAMTVPAGSNGTADFQLTPLSMWHVRGAISGGPEGAGPQLTLYGTSGAFAAPVRADGSFEIENVPSGKYFLTATMFQESERYMAVLPVEVAGNDVDGIRLHLEKGLDISGTVKVVSTDGRKIDNPRYTARLIPVQVAGDPGQTMWNDEKTSFTLTGVAPGSYRFQFSAPAPFYVQSATSGGRDIQGSDLIAGPGTPDIEVVLTDAGGAMEGSVSDDDGPAEAEIVVQQDGSQHWNAHADADGHFRIDGIPPGDYKVSAWNNLTNVEYGNPAWMQVNAKSVAVTVQAGQNAVVKLTRAAAPNE